MSTSSNRKAKEWVVWAAVAVLIALLLAAAGLYVLQKHQWAQARLAELEPRYARLMGVDAQGADISAALKQTREALARYSYPANQDVTVSGNSAQQRLREILAGAGLQISSSQVLAAKPAKGFDRIPIAVRAEGEWLAVQSALAVMSTQLPVIVVDDFEIQVVGGLMNMNPKVHPRLTVNFVFSVFKERS